VGFEAASKLVGRPRSGQGDAAACNCFDPS
jgi:hypothetical protein